MTNQQAPKTLQNLFVFHFIADIAFAIPLFFFPTQFLNLLQFQSIDPVSARLVAAALFAIGIKSLLEKKASLEIYRSMLSLKIIWSLFASIGLLYSVLTNEFTQPIIGWTLFGIFFIFHLTWLHWKKRLG